MSVTAYVALGSNLGDRRAHLDQALGALRQRALTVKQVSSHWETAAQGGPAGQGDYLNAVAEIETELPAVELLANLLEIEKTLGRIRNERFGPRTIDLDLLLFGESVINLPGLSVPHPRMHARGFVLGPLAEIAPAVLHPVIRLTPIQLLARLGESQRLGESTQIAVGRSLRGLRAVVTGSSRGIGRAIALAFAEHDAEVVVHARKATPEIEAVRRQAEMTGIRASVLTADLGSQHECDQFAEAAWEKHGPIDVWVNNAGGDILTGANCRLPFDKKLELLWNVDVLATIRLSRDIGERMRRRGSGLILNMGWDKAETGMEGESGQLFAATKAAVMAFSKSLALTLAPEVRVNCLAPGWIRTAWGENASEAWQERVKRETPLGRWGTPEDVAATAVWLASPSASFITGQVIRINGGAVS